MRKLKLQMQISVDGYVAGPNKEMDWMTWNWDEEALNYVSRLTEPVDTILLGRNLAEGFIPYWANEASKPEPQDASFARKMHDTPKIVFTRTLEKSDWPNTKLAKGNLADEITKLKNEPGHDIIVYGGANFVTNLIKENLIDELYLFVNPVAIGKGLTILDARTNLKLMEIQAFGCGIVAMKYQQSL